MKQKNQLDKFKDFSMCSEEEGEGGPSTRLRKRVPKVEESEAKPKGKATQRKKVNNATALKVSKTKDEEAEYECDIDGCTTSFGSKQELAVHKRNICPFRKAIVKPQKKLPRILSSQDRRVKYYRTIRLIDSG
ncbi:hypothetical protein K1719_020112 [Acacia pycnantha]|nr:hypothetical protein K1719_020112 [Acacia pycnantha]